MILSIDHVHRKHKLKKKYFGCDHSPVPRLRLQEGSQCRMGRYAGQSQGRRHLSQWTPEWPRQHPCISQSSEQDLDVHPSSLQETAPHPQSAQIYTSNSQNPGVSRYTGIAHHRVSLEGLSTCLDGNSNCDHSIWWTVHQGDILHLICDRVDVDKPRLQQEHKR